MAVPASLTCAITGTRPSTRLMREFEQRTLLVVGEADGLARVHRQRQRVRAIAQMEVDQLAVAIEVDAAVARERRHRRVHEAWLERWLACLANSPAVRLGVEDAELLELAADVGLPLLAWRSAAARASARPGGP